MLDLGEIRSMAYYTGIAFRGYARGLGLHVCSGGRYDDLIAQFGPQMPAVGFALGIERAMLVSSAQVQVGLDVLFSSGLPAQVYALVADARRKGLRVEVDILPRHGQELVAYARQRNARRVVEATVEQRYAIYEQGTRRELTLEELGEEVRRWDR